MKTHLRDLTGNSIKVGDEVQNDHARFFIGAINESGLCSIDKSKPFSLLDPDHKIGRCIEQGNYSVNCGGMIKVKPNT